MLTTRRPGTYSACERDQGGAHGTSARRSDPRARCERVPGGCPDDPGPCRPIDPGCGRRRASRRRRLGGPGDLPRGRPALSHRPVAHVRRGRRQGRHHDPRAGVRPGRGGAREPGRPGPGPRLRQAGSQRCELPDGSDAAYPGRARARAHREGLRRGRHLPPVRGRLERRRLRGPRQRGVRHLPVVLRGGHRRAERRDGVQRHRHLHRPVA